jgi:hypothetical protein
VRPIGGTLDLAALTGATIDPKLLARMRAAVKEGHARSAVLRLCRDGHGPRSIAEALGLPLERVRALLESDQSTKEQDHVSSRNTSR